MIEQIWSNTQINFIVELVIACAILTRPLRKKKDFTLRLLLTSMVSIVLWCSLVTWTPFGEWLSPFNGNMVMQSLGYIICFFGVSIPVFLFSCDTDWKNMLSYASCAYAMQHISFVVMVILYAYYKRPFGMMLELVVMAIVYGITYATVISRMPRHDKMEKGQGTSLFFSVAIIVAVVILSVASNTSFSGNMEMFVISHVYSFICCIFFLWIQVFYRSSMVGQHEKDVFGLRKIAIEKHQKNTMASYRNLNAMQEEISDLLNLRLGENKEAVLTELNEIFMKYNTEVSPYSEVLNSILRDKKLRTKDKVEWTCICDAKKLSVLNVKDVYTILDNALDNAIECVMKYDDAEKRMIELQIFSKNGLLNISVNNFCDDELIFDGDFPVSGKKEDYRGYGLESIQKTIQKYDGEMRVMYKNQNFLLQIVIPIWTE